MLISLTAGIQRKLSALVLLSLAATAATAAVPLQYKPTYLPSERSTSWHYLNNLGHVAGSGKPDVNAPYHPVFYDGTQAHVLTNVNTNTFSRDINDKDQMVGDAQYLRDGFRTEAFVLSNNSVTYLGTLGGSGSSEAIAINNAGAVVGKAATASGDQHAYVYRPGSGMSDLGTLGGKYSVALDINDRGDILGQSTTATGEYHTFLYSNGVMTDLTTVAGIAGSVDLRNLRFASNGQIFGNYAIFDGEHTTDLVSFVYDFQHLSTYHDQEVIGINARGDMVTVDEDHETYLTSGGVRTNIRDLLVANTLVENLWAVDFNDQGQILAGYRSIHGDGGEILLSAVPEPETWAMLCAGLIMLGLAKRRQRLS